MTSANDQRVALITGAGRGIGREHALALADLGYAVVVNDLGVGIHGEGTGESPAEEVVSLIRDRGGKAAASGHDVGDWAAAGDLVDFTIAEFGRLDVLVNNAGIIRDTVLYKMTPELWDDVIRVHLRGTAAASHFAAVHWRERAKAGESLRARLVNTTSASGLYGNLGQTNYSAAKAGIVAFTLTAGIELARYGVTANVIAPIAGSRMLGSQFGPEAQEQMKEMFDPAYVARICAWLCTEKADDVTGRVFGVNGRFVYVGEGWQIGPSAVVPEGASVQTLDDLLPGLIEKARPNENVGGASRTS